MLVITRKPDEKIVFNNVFDEHGHPIEIVVCMVGIRGNKARIGTEAPRTVQVNRQEIDERIKRGLPKPVKS